MREMDVTGVLQTSKAFRVLIRIDYVNSGIFFYQTIFFVKKIKYIVSLS